MQVNQEAMALIRTFDLEEAVSSVVRTLSDNARDTESLSVLGSKTSIRVAISDRSGNARAAVRINTVGDVELDIAQHGWKTLVRSLARKLH